MTPGSKAARGRWMSALVAILFVAAGIGLAAAELSPAEQAEQEFAAARVRYDAEKTNAMTAVAFARAAFDWAEFAVNDRQREAIAEQGIEAARQAVRLKPTHGPAHFYLALNLGQLARTKRLSALGLIEEMEAELLKAIKLDANFDYAGPDRTIGLLYLQAPGWPISVGNRAKAERHLSRAVELAPEYPENQLALTDAWLRWKNVAAARRQAKALAEIWPKAREMFKGPEWADEWKDWNQEREEIQKRIAQEKE